MQGQYFRANPVLGVKAILVVR
ncbi:hypothetical protein C221_05190 [Escherichia coli O104:H4 str. 11-03943]|nr:hypothetical protein C221_05190 [Escherichia coli O104:H4 str. 11-03943]